MNISTAGGIIPGNLPSGHASAHKRYRNHSRNGLGQPQRHVPALPRGANPGRLEACPRRVSGRVREGLRRRLAPGRGRLRACQFLSSRPFAHRPGARVGRPDFEHRLPVDEQLLPKSIATGVRQASGPLHRDLEPGDRPLFGGHQLRGHLHGRLERGRPMGVLRPGGQEPAALSRHPGAGMDPPRVCGKTRRLREAGREGRSLRL